MSDLADIGRAEESIDFVEVPEHDFGSPPPSDNFVGGSSLDQNAGKPSANVVDDELSEEQARRDTGRLAQIRGLLNGLRRRTKDTEAPKPPERRLKHDEKVHIGLDRPLSDTKETQERFGVVGRWVADVDAGGKIFHIIDVRDGGLNRDFHIIDDSYKSANGKRGLKGVDAWEPVVIGRGHHLDRFEYPMTVSGSHFKVEYDKSLLDEDGELIITNMKPMNDTILTAYTKEPVNEPTPPPQRRVVVEDIRTRLADDRLEDNPNVGEQDEIAPYGYYMNHPKLGRNSVSVGNGVYLGGTAREAIVADGKSEILKQVYEELATGLRKGVKDSKTISTQDIVNQIMHKVQEIMPYDGPKASEISREYYGDKLVGLSTYVKEKAGVCRHQGLLAAYLVERFINEGFLHGTVGIERNTVDDFGGTHAWAVFKPRFGKPEDTIVIDPAQSFVGTKKQADAANKWEYRLSTDDY